MGNLISNPAFIEALKQNSSPPPPLSIDAQKEQIRVELNMAKADVKSKQEAYDKLDPASAVKRKTELGTNEANAYISGVQSRFNYEVKLFDTVASEVKVLEQNPAFLLAKKYKEDLSIKLKDLEEKNSKYKELANINKRRFLHANPDESIEGIFGFKSLDDRIYLLFWVCFLLFIFPASSFVIKLLGSKIGDSNTQSIAWILGIIFLCIFTHIILYKFL
jgi:hypothetical protein